MEAATRADESPSTDTTAHVRTHGCTNTYTCNKYARNIKPYSLKGPVS